MILDLLFQLDKAHVLVIDPDPQLAARGDAAQILPQGRILPVVKIDAPDPVSALRMKGVRLQKRPDPCRDEGDILLVHQIFLLMSVFPSETVHRRSFPPGIVPGRPVFRKKAQKKLPKI